MFKCIIFYILLIRVTPICMIKPHKNIITEVVSMCLCQQLIHLYLASFYSHQNLVGLETISGFLCHFISHRHITNTEEPGPYAKTISPALSILLGPAVCYVGLRLCGPHLFPPTFPCPLVLFMFRPS